MADTKKWFKVWASIIGDPDHSNLSLEDVGRWTRLGALIVSVGEAGRIIITPPARIFLAAMDCVNLESAKVAITRLPNVQIEEGKSDNGSFIVIMKNWFKYQVDSTSYERLKRSRCKRRGEEIRGDKNKKRVFVAPTIAEVTAYGLSIGYDINAEKFCSHYEASEWRRGKTLIRDWRAAVRTWKANDTSSSRQEVIR